MFSFRLSLRQWLFLFLLKIAFSIPSHNKARRIVSFLQWIVSGVSSSWILRDDRGVWLAPEIAKAKKREEFRDYIDSCDIVMLWIPGGCFRVDPSPLYMATLEKWITALRDRKKLKCAVFIAHYPKAPEFRYPAALDSILSTHHWLVDTLNIPSDKLVWGGEGAGAAIALDIFYRKQLVVLPKGLVLVSPYIGMEAGGDTWRKNNGTDFLTEAIVERMEKDYMVPNADGVESDDEDASSQPSDQAFKYLDPTVRLGDMLPRHLLIVSGQREVLLEDAGVLAERARDGGVDVQMLVLDNYIHLYSLFGPFLDQGNEWRRAVDQWIEFIASRHL